MTGDFTIPLIALCPSNNKLQKSNNNMLFRVLLVLTILAWVSQKAELMAQIGDFQ